VFIVELISQFQYLLSGIGVIESGHEAKHFFLDLILIQT
jgi:ribosome-associated protein YbcJ (S4-like RNA binding protein)